MTLPSKQELRGVIVDILTRARGEGRLGDLTVRIVLREIAAHYGLEEDVFHGKSYKPFIKDTVCVIMNGFNSNASEGDARSPERKVDKDGKDDGTAKSGKRKRQLTIPVALSKEKRSEEASASENEAPQRKKSSARSELSKQTKLGKTSKKLVDDTIHKSKAVIDSSDEEAAPKSSASKSARSPKKEKSSGKSSPPKQQQDDSDVEMDTGNGPGPSSAGSKPEPMIELVKKAKEASGEPMESELSSVFDEPQTKRYQKKREKPVKLQKDEKTKRGKKKEPLSKDEETVNKLKSIVITCGVRKVWKKEFEGLDRPSQQIKRLHSILADLGMSPRYSMEKAKAIRERRELAQELKEVQEFDKAMKRRGKKTRNSSETVESPDEDNCDADAPAQKRQNARASIMAFLQDQSEEE